MLDNLQRLKNAIETNNRISNAQKEVETLENDIKRIDEHTKLLMMDSTIKQMRVDALKKELENATPIDVDQLALDILKVLEQ